MRQAYIAAQYCPMPCVEVVFAKCRASGCVFAFCSHCGCAWFAPEQETWQLGDLGNCVWDYHRYAPGGVELATLDDIRQVGFESLVVEIQDGERWVKEFEWFNRKNYPRRDP
jgi:hypothetical protein